MHCTSPAPVKMPRGGASRSRNRPTSGSLRCSWCCRPVLPLPYPKDGRKYWYMSSLRASWVLNRMLIEDDLQRIIA